MVNETTGFTDLSIRESQDIEWLRFNYERLLSAYKNEIKHSVILSMENERLKESMQSK